MRQNRLKEILQQLADDSIAEYQNNTSDLEITFLFPWAIVLQEESVGMFGFVSMMIFLAILVIGFIYEWLKGALEWE